MKALLSKPLELFCALLLFLLAASCTRTLDIPAPVPNSGYLSGRLVEAEPGTDLTRPIALGSVSVPNTNLATASDANGNFTLGPLPEGRYRLQFSGPSVTGAQRQRLLSAVGVTRGATSALGDVSLKENAELAGRVLIGTQPAGNSGITVFVPGTDFVTTTADSGAWLLRQLPEGTVRAAAFRSGFRPATTTDLTLQGGTVTSAIDLVITPEPPQKARIAGTVLVLGASSGGVVVKAISLTAQKTVATGTSAADGSFALDTLTAEASDRPVARVPNLAVGAGVEVHLADPIVLGAAGSATGKVQCASAAQCDPGRLCLSGVCSDCASASQCGAGSSCSGGRCQRACTANADCPGQVCSAGRCRPCAVSPECADPALVCTGAGQCAHCRDRLDCPASLACLAAGCGSCAQDSDCGAGATCASGACAAGSCSSNDGCPLARACLSHQCGSCSADADCRFGQLCVTGVCLSGNCRTSDQCSSGFVCNAYQCGACGNDGDCGTGRLCLPTVLGQRCSPGDCRDTTNCTGSKSGLVCFGNTCTNCGGPVSCAAGQVCSSGLCVAATLHTLMVATSGSGTVTSAPGALNCTSGTGTCSAAFNLGDQLTLTAAPAVGFFFGGWSGVPGCGSSPSCTLVVTSDVAITAAFNAGASLAMATVGPGVVASSPAGISCPGTCSAFFGTGTTVTLTATPVAGYQLSAWSGAGCSGSGPCAVTLVQATTVTATFVKKPVLTVAPGGTGAGTITSSPPGITCASSGGSPSGQCSAPFPIGTSVTLTATTSNFGGWLSGGCSGTAATCNITLAADTTVSAAFGTAYTLGLTVTGPGAVSAGSGAIVNCGQGGPCSGGFPSGTAVVLTATPNAGGALSAWGGDCAASSGTTCTLSMSQARTATAAFTPVTALFLVQGDQQSAPAGALLPATVVVKVASAVGGAPLSGAAVTMSGPPGSVVTPPSASTDVAGRAIFGIRLARTLGSQSFTVTTPSAQLPLNVTATATVPPAGVITTLVNVDHVSGATGIPGPATVARVNGPAGLAQAKDGTIYFSSSNNQIFGVSPAGTLTVVVGTGTCGHTGDLGPATAAQICGAGDLALDETHSRKTLYLIDVSSGVSLVRAVDLTAATPPIYPFAGGGSATGPGYGDGGPATAAVLNSPSHLAVDPAGNFLFVADSGIGRFRRIDLGSGLISAWVQVPAGTTCVTTACGSFVINDCTIGFDNGQNPYVTFAPGNFSNQCSGGAASGVYQVSSGGATTLVVGAGTATGEGIPALGAALATAIGRPIFDAAGNLYLVERNGNRIRRVDAGVGRINTIAGTGTAGSSGDGGDSRLAQLSGPWAALFDASQNLIIADSGSSAVRSLSAAGASTASGFTTLTVTSLNPQSVQVDQITAPFSVLLRDPSLQPIPGATVNWAVVDPGAALFSSTSITNLQGVAVSQAQVGLLAGVPYRFTAKVDVFGGPLPTSPATLTVNTTAPPGGSMITAVDVEHLAGASGFPGAATRAHINNPTGVAAAKDGTLYFAGSGNNQVFALSPAGELTVVVGTGTSGHGGDGGPATLAQLSAPLDLALDQTGTRKMLYVVDGSLIRAVDLTLSPPLITTFAGGGTAMPPGYGDKNPATFAVLNSPSHIAVSPAGDFLYIVDNGIARFRRVDMTGGPTNGIIDTWLTPPANTTCVTTACSSFVYNDCTIGFDNSQTPYVAFAAGNLNTQCSGGSPGAVYRVAANLSTTLVAGGGTNTGEGVLATSAAISPSVGRLLFDPTGALYLVERLGHRVRKLSDLTATATIRTVIGTGTAGNGADGPNPLNIAISSPWGLAVLPDGKMVISDSGNSTVRVIWPPYP